MLLAETKSALFLKRFSRVEIASLISRVPDWSTKCRRSCEVTALLKAKVVIGFLLMLDRRNPAENIIVESRMRSRITKLSFQIVIVCHELGINLDLATAR